MNLYKKATGLISLFLLFVFASSAQAQRPVRQLPHYFPPGIVTDTKTPTEQWAEYLRWVGAVQSDFYGDIHWRSRLIADGIRVEKTIDGKKFPMVLDHYTRLADGRIRFVSYSGSEIITEDQLKVVIGHTFNETVKAIDANFAFYQDLRERALKSVSEAVNIPVSELERLLRQEVPENPKFTFEEFFWLPKKMEKKDFVPRELHIGYGPDVWGALGWAWLDTGLVYLNPMAQVLDYLIGKPVITQHELVHANKVLQSFPFSEAFDVELAASIPEMLTQGDYIHLQFHSYVEDLREMAWVFWGYDYKRLRREIIKFDAAGVLMIDEQRFNEASALLETVKAEYMKFFPKAIGEFYGKMMFVAALHDKLVDRRAIWRIMMRKEYEPTILGGKENTARWLSANEGNIREDALKAWEESGKPSGDNTVQMETFYSFARVLGIDPNDRAQLKRLAKQFNINPEDLQKMDQEQMLELARKILNTKYQQKGGAR